MTVATRSRHEHGDPAARTSLEGRPVAGLASSPMPIEGEMPLQGSCNGCGVCCRVLVLEQSPEEVRQMAVLTRALGIP
jgi:hypothetical protein